MTRRTDSSTVEVVDEDEVEDGAVSAKERRTNGDSSASTARARRAVEDRCAVGKGMWRVLWLRLVA